MSNLNIIVTDHAYKRAKERMGLSKGATVKMSRIAYDRGIRHTETRGRLHKYIDERCTSDTRKGNDVRIYGEFVYCFLTHKGGRNNKDTTRLLTVYGIPNELKNQAISSKRRQSLAC